MYLNTTYKDFVAKAAIEFAGKMLEIEYKSGNIDDDDYVADQVAGRDIVHDATLMAYKLADELKDEWECRGDKETTFFDPDDTTLTRIENAIHTCADKLDDIHLAM